MPTSQIIENKQTDRSENRGAASDIAMQGLIPTTGHANVHCSLSSVHCEWFTHRSNRIHTFTAITPIVATKVSRYIQERGSPATQMFSGKVVLDSRYRHSRFQGLPRNASQAAANA